MGFELVQVRFMKGARSTTLQVMAEPVDRQRTMTVEDCAEISHAISAVLDVADPVASAYRLEVSSPGVDRPLARPVDFERFAGQSARIELDEPLDGRRKFRGVLAGLEDGRVVLNVDGVTHRLAIDRIAKAKLTVADGVFGKRGEKRRVGRSQRTG
jgi:ribosome maturation factor RimP